MIDIYVIGMGMQNGRQMTIEALEGLAACKTAFVAALNEEEIGRFSELIGRYQMAEMRFPRLLTLSAAYDEQDQRRDNYRRAAEVVVTAAASAAPVAYLTPGNPMVFDSVATEIIVRARSAGYTVEVRAGVSCIDSVLADLQTDAAPGLHVLEAQWALDHDVEIDTTGACLLLQVHLIGTDQVNAEPQLRRASVARLSDYLIRKYSLDHEVFIVRSASVWHEESCVQRISISALRGVASESLDGASLFLPPRATARRSERS